MLGPGKSADSGPEQFVEAALIAGEGAGAEDLLLLGEVVARGLFSVENAVADVETGRIGQGNVGAVAAAADHLDRFVVLVVDDGIGGGVATDAGDFFDGGFRVKFQRWYGSILVREFGDEGGEEVGGGGAGGSKLRFQRVDQGHQLLHFRHDPALFGEGWDSYRHLREDALIQVLHCGSDGRATEILPRLWCADQEGQKGCIHSRRHSEH